MSERVTVKAQCGSCGGTGVYCGFAEPEGIGVVCLSCNGTGCKDVSYTPFTTRRVRSDVRRVRCSRGSFILACGPTGSEVSYQQFLDGAMPQR